MQEIFSLRFDCGLAAKNKDKTYTFHHFSELDALRQRYKDYKLLKENTNWEIKLLPGRIIKATHPMNNPVINNFRVYLKYETL